MDECNDCFEVGIGKVLWWHPFVGAAIAYHRNDLVATNIFGDER
jgi:hypothetical protein